MATFRTHSHALSTQIVKFNLAPDGRRESMVITDWSDEEEHVIATIQQVESVPRPEAIRRMQRRKKASSFSVPRPHSDEETRRAALRLCRNPRCTRGDDGGPASLAHLRADALYCDPTCKKAGQRSPSRQNRPSNRQCLCGSKGDKSASRAPPLNAEVCVLYFACNRDFSVWLWNE
jgi:hypothetical protein